MSKRAQNTSSGRSFKGHDLSGADFSSADIRGTDFTNATLVGANFRGAKAGQRCHWMVMLIASLIGLTILVGYALGYVSAFFSVLMFLDEDPLVFWSSIVALVLAVPLLFMVYRYGLRSGALTIAIIIVFLLILIGGLGKTALVAAVIIQTIGFIGAIAGTVIGGFVLASLRKLTRTFTIGLYSLFAILGGISGLFEGIEIDETRLFQALPLTLLVFVVLFGLSVYLGWNASEDTKYLFIYKPANFFASLGGTSFYGADLENANFAEANLRSSDLRTSNLSGISWHHAKNLDTARIRGTYLEQPKIRQLVLTKIGKNQCFDDLNLRRLNLEGAYLDDATFIRADLSGANLSYANLSRATLLKAQLYQTNLNRACLTGAYIQDWAISTDTQLDDIQCDYVYMHVPTLDDPDPWRKPDNRNEIFKDGDFSDFIAPIIKTLDLYQQQNIDPRRMAHTFKTLDFFHHEGLDPSAAAVALKQLADQYPDAGLEIVALEGRGDEKIRMQARVTGQADRSKLSMEYFDKYQKLSNLSYPDLQSLLVSVAEKDERIQSLETMLTTAIKSSRFYVETYYNLGDTVSEKGEINIQAGGDIGNVSGLTAGDVKGVINLGTISGSVTNAINQLPNQGSSDQAQLKALLNQLQALIETEEALPDEDKAEALEQVKTLAEAGQKPEDNALQKASKTSIKILKGTVASLPDAAKLAEACVKLLPAIATLLALV